MEAQNVLDSQESPGWERGGEPWRGGRWGSLEEVAVKLTFKEEGFGSWDLGPPLASSDHFSNAGSQRQREARQRCLRNQAKRSTETEISSSLCPS